MGTAKYGFTLNVKNHRRASFNRIPSRTTIHMYARPTSKVWKYIAVSVSEENRRNKRTKTNMKMQKENKWKWQEFIVN